MTLRDWVFFSAGALVTLAFAFIASWWTTRRGGPMARIIASEVERSWRELKEHEARMYRP